MTAKTKSAIEDACRAYQSTKSRIPATANGRSYQESALRDLASGLIRIHGWEFSQKRRNAIWVTFHVEWSLVNAQPGQIVSQ